jgi:phage terminase large subunit-like protein
MTSRNSNYIKEYHDQIVSGKIIACDKIKKVMDKVMYDLEKQDEFYFDIERAQRPIDFIETYCKQSKGEWIGKSVKLMLWQKAIVQILFGFVDEEGNRKYREVLIVVGRKNGKSTWISALALYMLTKDGEGGAEVACVASKKDQARVVFQESVHMVSQSPQLNKRVTKRKTDLYYAKKFSQFHPLASDSNTLDGLNLHCGIMDEIHALKDRSIYDVTKQSMSARRQPMLIMITTAGFVRESIYDDKYKYAEQWFKNELDDTRFIPFIFELDSTGEWTDETKWMKANPALGVTKKLDTLRADVETAKVDKASLPTVLTKDFNIRATVGKTWMEYDDCHNDLEYTEFKDAYCIGGVDLSATTDLTCATLIAEIGDQIFVKQMYWLPSSTFELRIKEDHVKYDVWVERGLMRISDGTKINYSDVTKWFWEQVNDYGLRPLWVGYDSWSAQYWSEEMKNYGFDMVEVRQGAKTMSQPMKQMEADFKAKKINYNKNPILEWCLTNTAIKEDENGNIRPIKNKSWGQRIDGAVSLIDAYVVMMDKYNDYLALTRR